MKTIDTSTILTSRDSIDLTGCTEEGHRGRITAKDIKGDTPQDSENILRMALLDWCSDHATRNNKVLTWGIKRFNAMAIEDKAGIVGAMFPESRRP